MRLVEHRGKWAVRIAGRRHSTGYDAKPEHRDAAERQAREIARALTAPLTSKCEEIVRAYFADMPRRATPKEPKPEARYAAKAVLRWFGTASPEQVTRDACRDYIASRRSAGRSDSTIRNELRVLQSALNWCDKNGPHQIEMPAPAPPRDRWLTVEEVGSLIEASMMSPHVHTFVHVALATGARKEAILGMSWDTHVSFERGTVWPGFKPGGKGRAKPIPMTSTLRSVLEAALGMAQTPYVIEWGGRPVKSIRRALAGAYKRAGIEGVAAPAHVLRHTAGAWMTMDGVPLLEVSRRLGHSSIRVTEKHYAHLAPEAMMRSTAALDLGKKLVCGGSIEPPGVNRKATKAGNGPRDD